MFRNRKFVNFGNLNIISFRIKVQKSEANNEWGTRKLTRMLSISDNGSNSSTTTNKTITTGLVNNMNVS